MLILRDCVFLKSTNRRQTKKHLQSGGGGSSWALVLTQLVTKTMSDPNLLNMYNWLPSMVGLRLLLFLLCVPMYVQTMNYWNVKRKRKKQKTQESKVRLMIYWYLNLFTKNRKRPQGRYAHLGSRASPKRNKNAKCLYLSRNRNLKRKGWFVTKKTNISCKKATFMYVAYNVTYLTYKDCI